MRLAYGDEQGAAKRSAVILSKKSKNLPPCISLAEGTLWNEEMRNLSPSIHIIPNVESFPQFIRYDFLCRNYSLWEVTFFY
jgi:hypothetical protein